MRKNRLKIYIGKDFNFLLIRIEIMALTKIIKNVYVPLKRGHEPLIQRPKT